MSTRSFSGPASVLAFLLAEPGPANAAIPAGPIENPISEPPAVRSAALVLRTSCAAWPEHARFALPVVKSGVAPVAPFVLEDAGLCDLAEGRDRSESAVATVASIFTIIGLFVAAGIAGALRMILVTAWLWRPRRFA